MTRAEIERTLLAIAHDELEWEPTELPTGPIADHFDSLQLMTLVVAVEDRFRLRLEPEDEDRIDTIEDLISMIREKHAA